MHARMYAYIHQTIKYKLLFENPIHMYGDASQRYHISSLYTSSDNCYLFDNLYRMVKM